MTYKGNPVLSFDGAVLCFCIVLFSIGGLLAAIQKSLGMAAFCFVFDAILYIMAARRFYYFNCSENDFVVENQLMFWTKKSYRLSNLNQVKFEMPFKMPGCVTLITKDFETSRFPAGSLTDRQWIALKDQLEKQNVPIQDEFVKNIVFYEFVLFDEIKEIFTRFKKK